MKKINFLLVIVLVLLNITCLKKQESIVNSNSDDQSLIKQTEKLNAKHDVDHIDTLLIEFVLLRADLNRTKNLDTMIQLARMARELSELVNYNSGIAKSNLIIAMGFPYKPDSALRYYFDAIKVLKTSRNYKTLAETFYSMASYLEMNPIIPIVKLGSIVQNRSLFYMDSSIVYYQLAKDTSNWLNALTYKGELLLKRGEVVEAGRAMSKALSVSKYFKYNRIASILIDIGRIHFKKREYDSSLYHLKNAIKVCEMTRNNGRMADALSAIALTYSKLGLNNLAIKNALLSLNLAENDTMMLRKFEILNTLDEVYKSQKDFSKALVYSERLNHLKDSVYQLKLQQNLSQYNLQLEAEKNIERVIVLQKDKQLQLQIAKRQQLLMYALIIGLLVLIILSFVINLRYQAEKRALHQLEISQLELINQKELAELHAARAEESERFEHEFLANMSHEIRTPMHAVMGMTNLLLSKNPRPDQLKYLNGMRQSSETLLHIINDILDLSKIEAGKLELEEIDFSIIQVIDHVVELLKHKAEEKDIHLYSEIDIQGNQIFMGDPIRLNQVLMNLVGNAIKFTDKGSVFIEVKAKDKSGQIKFSIIDTGIGIPKDKLQSVFNSFSQAHRSDSRIYGGTGLGLTISKQFVELMGGVITIESVEGAGSKFSFELDFKEGSQEQLNAQKTSNQIDGSILSGLNILLVDDNDYNRTVAKDTLLLKAELKIDEAKNGKEAVDLVSKNNYDIILMDVQMPVMDGYQATKYIRENFNSPKNKIPIIALTASVIRSDIDKCLQSGMNDYVPKPFKMSMLISTIAKLTNRHESNVSFQQPNETFNDLPPISDYKNIVTDLTYLFQFCEGDKVRMNKYMKMFTDTAPALIEKIQNALKQKDYNELANQIHSFKTKWIMMGMTETKELALKIEHLCREKPEDANLFKYIDELVREVQSAISEILEKKV